MPGWTQEDERQYEHVKSRAKGTGNPNTELESRSKVQLENRAEELGIANRGKMTKQELIAAIRNRE